MTILLTTKQVARRRHMTEMALAVERYRGQGPAFLVDRRRVLYPEDELEKYLKRCQVKPRKRRKAA